MSAKEPAETPPVPPSPAVATALKAVNATPRLVRVWRRLAKVLTDDGQPTTAIALMRQAIVERPSWPGPRYALVLALCEAGETETAADTLAGLKAMGATAKRLPLAYLDYSIALAEQDWPAVAAGDAWSLSISPPQRRRMSINVAAALIRLGQTDRARAHLVDHASRVAITRQDLQTLVNVLCVVADRDAALDFLDWAKTALRCRLHVQGALIHLESHFGRSPRSRAMVLEAVQEAAIDDVELGEWALATLGPRLLGNVDLRGRVVAAMGTALDGQFAMAADMLDDLSVPATMTDEQIDRFSMIAALFRRLDAAPPPGRAPLSPTETDAILGRLTGKTGRVALIFGGITGMVGGLPPRLVDHLFARQGYDALFLTDRTANGGVSGYAPLGDTAIDTVAALQDTLARHNYDEVLSIGVAGGGYAALRYGIALDADRIVTFSGGTVTRSEDMRALGDHRITPIAERVSSLDPAVNFLAPVSAILPMRDTTPEIALYFGARNADDSRQAQALDGLPGVELRPIDSDQHNSFLKVISQAAFSDVFE